MLTEPNNVHEIKLPIKHWVSVGANEFTPTDTRVKRVTKEETPIIVYGAVEIVKELMNATKKTLFTTKITKDTKKIM